MGAIGDHQLLAEALREVADDLIDAHFTVGEDLIGDSKFNGLAVVLLQVGGALAQNLSTQREFVLRTFEHVLQSLLGAHKGHGATNDLSLWPLFVSESPRKVILQFLELLFAGLCIQVLFNSIEQFLCGYKDMELQDLSLTQIFIVLFSLAIKELDLFERFLL